MTADRRNAAADPHAAVDADVLIVGYGPVGQVLALLLAERGRRVIAIERHPRPYPMPRAVAFDSEGARILSAAGIGDVLHTVGEPSGEYTWQNADGDVLLHIDVAERGLCGWPESTSMYQPALEDALIARGRTLPSLRVLRPVEVVRLDRDPDGGGPVTAHTRDADGTERTVRAHWVVGCDGANSTVRRAMGSTLSDSGFAHEWLICDVVPHDRKEFRPNNTQICDPARPRTSVSAGPGHRRWEFMRVPGDPAEGFNTPETAWRLLRLFGVDERNATLERHHVYTFQAGVADVWRDGRLLLAGDAAHVMPPFAGQGMSSGFRDAANLAWKLEAVLAGRADASLLDSYPAERRTHVQHAIGMSVNLGRIICETDPKAAGDRDVIMMASARRAALTGKPPERSPLHPLGGGLLRRDARGRPLRPAGELLPQARVERAAGGPDGAAAEGWFDAVVGTGFTLLCAGDPAGLLAGADPRELAVLHALGGRVVEVLPPRPAAPAATGPGPGPVPARSVPEPAAVPGWPGPVIRVHDAEDVYRPRLAAAGAAALLVRPDFYVLGAASGAADLPELLGVLRTAAAGAAPADGSAPGPVPVPAPAPATASRPSGARS
ncbi:bifunctional 3-(3-hydroxy-phenyl)propionate/3-hydroxycinnamic acid hydroxylase MhpA [Streptomyces carpaticus]|uniref:Bifunctional 3-(3-hydroxy-phenyl)propionate/3-hydroxycinnamic acid hydroxylase n=1 Tax=Streptomyces carpaticus TaxID=285558 RepID=A0ABV4ZTV9_9ACTN